MEKLRLIQCGCGGMGKAWWSNATNNSPDFDLVALVDIADAPLNEAGDSLNIPEKNRFKTVSRALNKIQADAILTVTPPAIHSQHAKLAFSHGLHVLTEKPIADTLPNAKKMVRQAADAGKQLMVAQNYRYHAPMQVLRRLVQEKPLGEIGHGHLDFYIAADFTGSFRQSMPYPLLIDMSIHHFDLIRAVMGQNIARVMVTSYRPPWSWFDHDPVLKMLLELDDGRPFTYTGDWTALGKQTGWNGYWRLQCAQGSINYENDDITIWRSDKWAKNQIPEKVPIEEQQNSQARLLSEFAKSIRTNHPAETNGSDNLHSFACVTAGLLSAKKRRPIEVAKLLEGK